jgi:predicted dehydrogenase
MVGFNRRFAPLAQHARKIISSQSGPKTITININAGILPLEHWALNPTEGGGRVVGEVCHFVDLLRLLISTKFLRFNLSKIIMTAKMEQNLNSFFQMVLRDLLII